MPEPTLDLDIGAVQAVAEARHGDPFGIFGPHFVDGQRIIRSYQPGAVSVTVLRRQDGAPLAQLQQQGKTGIFRGPVGETSPYLLQVEWPEATQETEDPYSFGTLLAEDDLQRLRDGRHYDLGTVLGAHHVTIDRVRGVRFAVWAPNAERVSVLGDFNSWDGRRHVMRLRHHAGVWEIFIPRLLPGAIYKYEIRGPGGNVLPLKADPVGGLSELPPLTGSVVPNTRAFAWSDADWLRERSTRQADDRPISIYEVHTASWVRPDGQVPDWDQLGDQLIPYIRAMGFSHAEFLPIMEHPFSGSWGYQPLGLFAPTSRHGDCAGFARLVDRFHATGLGVILDWVPGHFPNDAYGLSFFDGTHLYEHQDPREGFHRDWNTLIYNFGRNEVRSFLISSALHWLRLYHVDGLRVDAVASMLYRDYSRPADQWIPNIYGRRENLEAISLFQELNSAVGAEFPDAMMIAEESTAWPGVTRAASAGGLGFTHKWNMGWMNDSLRYITLDPVYRSYHHHDMTFSLLYSFSEKFILPLSHDEVVHGKKSIFGRMPGDKWQALATMRAYLAFMWCHPGKKLVFMGTELAAPQEWNHDAELPWHLLDDPAHKTIQLYLRDLNMLYRERPALHELDHAPEGFVWLCSDDYVQSIFAFLRVAKDGSQTIVVSNFTPVPRFEHRIGVPKMGRWAEILNSDSGVYGGSNIGNGGFINIENLPWQNQPFSASISIPPLATVIFGLP